MKELAFLLLMAVVHEVLCVVYTIALAERRPILAGTMSGIIAAFLLTIFVRVAEAEHQIAGIVVVSIGHAGAAWATTRWLPKKRGD